MSLQLIVVSLLVATAAISAGIQKPTNDGAIVRVSPSPTSTPTLTSEETLSLGCAADALVTDSARSINGHTLEMFFVVTVVPVKCGFVPRGTAFDMHMQSTGAGKLSADTVVVLKSSSAALTCTELMYDFAVSCVVSANVADPIALNITIVQSTSATSYGAALDDYSMPIITAVGGMAIPENAGAEEEDNNNSVVPESVPANVVVNTTAATEPCPQCPAAPACQTVSCHSDNGVPACIYSAKEDGTSCGVSGKCSLGLCVGQAEIDVAEEMAEILEQLLTTDIETVAEAQPSVASCAMSATVIFVTFVSAMLLLIASLWTMYRRAKRAAAAKECEIIEIYIQI